MLYFLLYNCNHPFSIEHQKGGGKVGRTGIKARTARFSRHELYAHVHVGMQGWCKGRSYISQAPAFVPLHSWLRSWIAVGSRENSRLPVSDRTEYTRGSLSLRFLSQPQSIRAVAHFLTLSFTISLPPLYLRFQASSPLPLSLPLPHFTRFIIISPFVSPLNSQLDGGSDICLSAILCAACNSAESCCFQSFLEIVYTWILIIEILWHDVSFERKFMYKWNFREIVYDPDDCILMCNLIHLRYSFRGTISVS